MKKLLALALSCTMIASLLAGCSKPAPDAPATTAGGGSATAAPQGGGDAAGLAVGDPFGSADAPVEVSIIIKDVSPSEESTQQIEAAIEAGMAELGQYVDLVFMDSPSGTYGEATPIGVRTGQISPDLIYFQGGDVALANEGILEDLTAYVEASTNIKNLMEPFNVSRIESYPYLLWLAPARVNVPYIRSDYVAQYDSVKTVMDDPTIENYKAMYVDLMDKGVCDYGFTSDGGVNRLDSIYDQAFGVTGTYMKTEDGYISSMISQEEKNKLEFYAELYAEGIIDPNYITNKWDVMEDNFYTGKSATMAGTGGIAYIYNNHMIDANGESAALAMMPPATGVGQGLSVVDVTKEERGFAINSDSSVKVEAFAVLEFMASDAGRLIDKLGIEGVHYVINADGTYETTDRYSEWWARIWDTWHNFPEDVKFVEDPVSDVQKAALNAMSEYYTEDVNVILPDELQPTYDALVTMYTSYAVDIITGVRPISDFDEMVDEWYAYGGADIHDYVTANY